MSLSKHAFGQVIRASAASGEPIDDDILREIAAERGDDPEMLVVRHAEMRDDYFKNKQDNAKPMPFITPRS